MLYSSFQLLLASLTQGQHCLNSVTYLLDSVILLVLALDLEGVHDLKLHHPSSSVATSNQ